MRRPKIKSLPMLCAATMAALSFVAGALPKAAHAATDSVTLALGETPHGSMAAAIGLFAAAMLVSALIATLVHLRRMHADADETCAA